MRTKLFAALLLACAMSAPAPAAAQDLRQAIHADMPDLMNLYRDLHAHPELSMQETRSAARRFSATTRIPTIGSQRRAR